MVGTFTKRMQDAAARGAAGGSRGAVGKFMRTAIWIWWLGIGFVALVVFRACQIDADDDGSPAPSTAANVIASSSAESISHPVRLGDRGDAVVVVQEALVAAGHELAVDGVFGAETDAAVREFQSGQGLAVDGVVGEETGSALGIWSV
ncbi:MAG TPA: peptidoglycan-binding domain-containing protein [Acidimicrobiales bacterium]|jgi:peptidoglycan hydrolase-like protein with peptidoglycan-binding domain|nr:peptidoglycan-binding domain-containing protein [Acidimicrobiales bacterium]